MNIIDSGESGVETKFGRVSNTPLEEGFYFSLSPFVSLDVYNTKVKTFVLKSSIYELPELKNNEILYGDSVIIQTKESIKVPLDMTVSYQVRSRCTPLIRKNYGVDGVWDKKLIVPKVNSVAWNVIGKYSVYELNEKKKYFESEIKRKMNRDFFNTFGQVCVDVKNVVIQNIYLPKGLKKLKKGENNETEITTNKDYLKKRRIYYRGTIITPRSDGIVLYESA